MMYECRFCGSPDIKIKINGQGEPEVKCGSCQKFELWNVEAGKRLLDLVDRFISEKMSLTGIAEITGLSKAWLRSYIRGKNSTAAKFSDEDRQALAAIRRGDEKGLKDIYRQYKSKLKIRLLHKRHPLSEELAEDICDRVFFHFFKKIRLYEERGGVFAWLWKLASDDKIMRDIKKETKRKNQEEPLDDFNDLEDTSIQEMEKESYYDECIRKAFERLKRGSEIEQKCYRALTLRIEGVSIKEIAKEIGKTEGATRAFLCNCRKRLKDC